MKNWIRHWRLACAAILMLASLVWSVWIRVDVEPSEAAKTSDSGTDPATGAILVDLEDDFAVSERGRIASILRRAIAPFPWHVGKHDGLGTRLSEAAQLYRIEAPSSEHQDVLRMLRNVDGVEGVEVERYWSLPESAVEPVEGLAARRAALEPSEETRRDPRKPFVPNDPYYKHQWHLDQIQMPQAWLESRGKGAVVAIIDTGVAFESRQARKKRFKVAPDLEGVRFVPGYDFVDRDNHPTDEHGHGTHVAGTVAQATNNGLGVAGVAPAAAIMPLRVLDGRGRGSFGDVAAAIRWAADHGAHVINMSLGGGMPSAAVRTAIAHAHSKGVTVVAAAGNAGKSRVEYPARHQHVIAVGAVRFDEQLTFYSCYGRGLDVVAPGGDTRVDQNEDGVADGVLQNTLVPGTTDKHDYMPYMGTSMAAPHVAGVAALLWAEGVRDPDTLEAVLKATAKKKKDSRRYASGLIQAKDALRGARRGFGGLRGLFAVAFAALMLFSLQRKGRLSSTLRPKAAILWSLVLAGGVAVVPLERVLESSGSAWLLGPLLSSLGHELVTTLAAGLPALTLQQGPWGALVGLSILIPGLATGLFLGRQRGHAFLFGLASALVGCMLCEAIVPTTDLSLVPSILTGPWVLFQGALVGALAFLIALPARRAS